MLFSLGIHPQIGNGTWSQCVSEVPLLPSGFANQTTASDPAAGAATNSSREPVIASHGTICQLPLLYNAVQVGAAWISVVHTNWLSVPDLTMCCFWALHHSPQPQNRPPSRRWRAA